MQTGDVTYERDGATLRAYAAWPDAAGRVPALVLIPDVRGVSDHYRDVARRFAVQPCAAAHDDCAWLLALKQLNGFRQPVWAVIFLHVPHR